MRKAEVNSIVISIISSIGVIATSFWVANVAPYLLGLAGGALHLIAAHEHGVVFRGWKIAKLAFVSLVGGAGGLMFAHKIGMEEYRDFFTLLGGFISWESLMWVYSKKDSLLQILLDRYLPKKGEDDD